MWKYTAYEQFKLCNRMINPSSMYVLIELSSIDVVLKNIFLIYVASIDYSELKPKTFRFPVSLFLSNCSLSSHANANKYCFGCHATVNVAASIGISVILIGKYYKKKNNNKTANIITDLNNKYLK